MKMVNALFLADNDEHLIWTDFFASLFLTMALLVNGQVQSMQLEIQAQTSSEPRTEVTKVQLYLNKSGQVSKTGFNTETRRLQNMLNDITPDSVLVIMAEQNVNADKMYETFATLRKHRFEFEFSVLTAPSGENYD